MMSRTSNADLAVTETSQVTNSAGCAEAGLTGALRNGEGPAFRFARRMHRPEVCWLPLPRIREPRLPRERRFANGCLTLRFVAKPRLPCPAWAVKHSVASATIIPTL